MPKTKEDIAEETSKTRPSATEKYDASKIDKPRGFGSRSQAAPACISATRTSSGCITSVFEVLDNSIDEHLAGYCNKIEVTIHVDGSVSIRDDGRGHSVDMHPKWKMPAVELVADEFARGRKIRPGRLQIFRRPATASAPKCVNALSDWFRVESRADEKVYSMEFERGKTTTETRGHWQIKKNRNVDHVQTRSRRFFKPSRRNSNSTILANRLRELAFLIRALKSCSRMSR